MLIFWVIGICFVLFLVVNYILHSFRFGVVSMVNGGVKSGKTCLVVSQGIKSHRRSLLKYRIKKFFYKIFKKNKILEFPYLYSNIPLKYKYYKPLLTEHIKRELRFEYGSVVVLSEVSLVANSMNYRDELLNEEIELFIKLFGHETRGGKMFIDTQALGDNHYAIKRSIDRSVWIERLINIPLFPVLIYRVRSLMICDESAINISTDSGDSACKTILIPKSTFKRYDRYCYSVFTDSKDLDGQIASSASDLKARNVPTFRSFKTINIGGSECGKK